VVMFKVWKERPVMAVHMHHLYYVKEGAIRHVNVDKNKEKVVVKLDGMKECELVSMEYNPTEHGILVNSCVKDSHAYQLFFIIEGSNLKPKIKKSPGRCCVWSTHNRFAHLDASSQLVVKNLENQNVNFGGFSTGFLLRKSEPKSVHKTPCCDTLYPGGQTGHVLMRDGDQVILYDIIKKRRVNSGKFARVKQVLWSQDRKLLAMFSKHQLWLCDHRLKVLQVFKSRYPVKSVAWCEDTNTLVYTTDKQLMYLMISGDNGVLATIPEPMYIAMVRQDKVVCIDRKASVKVININNTEYMFKAAVINSKEVEMMSLIHSGKVMGQSMLQFLRSSGRPDLALSFISDPLSRFSLAVEANNLSAAMDAAMILDTSQAWDTLANLALLNGDLTMAEASYQKGRAYTKLMFLYLISGQRYKLVKLARILRVKGDFSGVYQAHLLTGEKGKAAELLEFAGNHELAELMKCQEPGILEPPEPVCQGDLNWPLIVAEESVNISNKEVLVETYRDHIRDAVNNSNDDTIDDDNDNKCSMTNEFSHISPGVVPDLKDSVSKLHNEYKISNFEPFRQILLGYHVLCPRLPCSPSSPPVSLPPLITRHHLDHLLARAHTLTTAGKFSSAVEVYRTIMLTTTLSRESQGALVKLCADYIVTLSMEMERKKCGKSSPMEKIRQCQLAIFSTKYNLLPAHSVLLLRSAVSVCLRVGNPRSAMAMARVLLTLSTSTEVSRFARSVLLSQEHSEDTFPMDAIVNSKPVICGGDFIVLDGPVATCPLCCVQFGRAFCGHVCPVDRVARIGHL